MKNIRIYAFSDEASPEIAKDYDITLCHENEKDIYGDTAERCLQIHKALPGIKGIFDPANLQVSINIKERCTGYFCTTL